MVRAALAAAVVALAAGVPWAWQRGTLLYWQRKCMNNRPGAAQVVYEPSQQAAAGLVQTAGYVPVLIGPGRTAAAWCPEAWRRLARSPEGAGMSPRVNATVFLGRVSSPAGGERLVSVDAMVSGTGADDPALLLSVHVLRLGWLFAGPQEVTNPAVNLGRARGVELGAKTTRLFAGQVDASDGSHFVIPFEREAKPGVIDGYLNADETVRLEARLTQQERARRAE
jgi:hypothetical protein